MFNSLVVSVLLVSPIFAASWLPHKFEIKPRIIGGEFAQPGQFKYMVSLRQEKHHFCGAALISARWVISAGHCVQGERLNASNVQIVVGVYQYSHDGVTYQVKQIIGHEKFDANLGTNDISLLQTKTRVRFGESIQPIQVGKQRVEPEIYGVFAGFGFTGPSGFNPFYLKFIELRVISNDECINKHSTMDQGWVVNSTLCTFIGDQGGTLKGDSGGALVFDNKVIGILSWGISSGFVKSKPDQFTRISEFADWIGERTGVKAV